MDLFSHYSLSEKVTELLRHRIISGYYKPGDRIKELNIAEELDISRGPVREAMKQLAEVGLVEHRAFKGNFVTTMAPQEAWKIYVLRADLEVLSLKLTPQGISEQILNQLEGIYQRMASPEVLDFQELVQLDLQFHRLICEACDNTYLLKLWESLDGFIYSLMYTVHTAGIRDIHHLAERHRTLLEALKRNDLKKSIEEVAHHYLSTAEILVKNEDVDMSSLVSLVLESHINIPNKEEK